MAEEVTWLTCAPAPAGSAPTGAGSGVGRLLWGGGKATNRVPVPCAAPGSAPCPWLHAGQCPGGAGGAALEGHVQPGTDGVGALALHPARRARTVILPHGTGTEPRGAPSCRQGRWPPTQPPEEMSRLHLQGWRSQVVSTSPS